MIDNVAKHPTPEGLMLSLVPAGLLPRCSAWLIDLFIRTIVVLVVYLVAFWLGEAGFGFIAIGYFLVNWGYSVFFEVYRDGMTPGKKRKGIYVCHDDGTPINLQASLIRNLLRVADFLPLGFMAAIICMLFNRQSKRLGDIVAGTMVVYREQQNLDKLYASIYGTATKDGSTQMADLLINQNNNLASQNNNQTNVFDSNSALFFYPLQLNEQQSMLSFLERLPFLSQPRQQEIASVLSPLVKVGNHADSNTDTENTGLVCQLAVIERARIIQGKALLNNHSQQKNNRS